MPDHYNLGVVFGVVRSAKPSKDKEKTYFVDVELDCSSALHGDPRAYGRFFGQAGKDFLEFHKKHAGEVVKASGVYSQYEKDGKTFSSYVFFNFDSRPDETRRANFVLTGELVSVQEGEDERVVYLRTLRTKGRDSEETKEETFRLCILGRDAKKNEALAQRLIPGETLAVKGLLRQLGRRDEFTDRVEGEVKPYIKELTIHA